MSGRQPLNEMPNEGQQFFRRNNNNNGLNDKLGNQQRAISNNQPLGAGSRNPPDSLPMISLMQGGRGPRNMYEN